MASGDKRNIINMYEDLTGGSAVKTDGVTIIDKNGNIPKNQCSAWVNFDGNDGTIRDSYNVSSVVRNDVGNYTINFTTAMNDTAYVVVSTNDADTSTGNIYSLNNLKTYNRTTTSVNLLSVKQAADDRYGLVDRVNNYVVIFGGK